jgi:predicted alpha/beta superfamily hydrolase
MNCHRARIPGALAASLVLGVCSLATAPGGCRNRPEPGMAPRRHVIENTEVRVLPRADNGREYLLYVALPDSYLQDLQRHYPVFYLCDGYWDFNLVKGFYGNLIYDQVVPEFILVGFGYAGDKPDHRSLRVGDYTPVADTRPAPQRDGRGSGHAAEFLEVVEHMVIPFVERQYRAEPTYRVLGGSSLGGLFTLYTLLAKPGLFQAYIAPSPSVNWANDWLFRYEDAYFQSGRPIRARLFMTGAEMEWPDLLGAIKRFDGRLVERAYPGLLYQFRLIDGERHAGTKAESYNRGVRFAFAPFAPAAGGSARRDDAPPP